ncbi:MAG: hypothetical protein R3343_12445 [Nitriliruptorales bacterium]|nr:hypothetical protein [Nitriliruptorales bacterium]
MMGSAKSTTYLAVAMIVGGFVLIVLAWNGAAGVDFVQGQIPYLISGGLAGLSLVIGGVGMVLVQEMRKSAASVEARLDELVEIMAMQSRSQGPTGVPVGGDHVVAGRTSYHLPTCHLVEDRNDLQAMSRETAQDRGLAPCRICEPQGESVSG